jgi:hypothetical protein
VSSASGAPEKGSEKKEEIDIAEIEQLIRSAPKAPYVRKVRNESCIYYENELVKCIPYNEELHKKLQEIANEVRQAFKGRGSTTVPSVSRPPSDIDIWLTSIRGRRPLVEHLVDKLAYGQTLITDLGMDFLIIGLMAADVDFSKLDELLYKFGKDPEALRRFILEKVVSLIAAAKSSTDLAKCREDIIERDATISLLESEYESLYNSCQQLAMECSNIRKKYHMLLDLFRMAMVLMPRDRLALLANIAYTMLLEEGGEQVVSQATQVGVAQ